MMQQAWTLLARLDTSLRWQLFWTLLTLLGIAVGLVGGYSQQSLLRMLGFALAFAAGGIPAARDAIAELRHHRRLNVDLLMVLAALGALSIGQAVDGAILLFLFSLSNSLQAWALGRTKRAIEMLKALHPEGGTVRRNGKAHYVALEDIAVGDILLVKPGERIVADAVVLQGRSSIDESSITGESIPVEKEVGSTLASGTVNMQGSLEAEVVCPAGESTLANLVRLMEQAQTQKSRTETLSERWESPYATLVLLATPIVFGGLAVIGGVPLAQAWYRSMSFMVVASPCAVIISTPAVMLSAMAAAAREGVLFKSSAALETLATIKCIAFDKTGTLTQGTMRVRAVEAAEAQDRNAVLTLAAGLEAHSEHPIAQAVVQAAKQAGINTFPAMHNVQAIAGHGVVGEDNEGQACWLGNRRMAARYDAALDSKQEASLQRLEAEGSSSVIVGSNDNIIGLISVADLLREDARSALKHLHAYVPHLTMLTGDKQEVAHYIAAQLGLHDVYAELLPEDKLRLISELPAPTMMVGDGVNDAPALAKADLGMAVGSGTDVALESADIVLMQNNLSKLAGAVKLAKRARRTVIFNLSVAFSIIVVVAPLAIAGLIPLPLGVIAHEGGTVFVALVGLTLLRHKLTTTDSATL